MCLAPAQVTHVIDVLSLSLGFESLFVLMGGTKGERGRGAGGGGVVVVLKCRENDNLKAMEVGTGISLGRKINGS